MSNEETILAEIIKAFPETEGKIKIQRKRRFQLEVEYSGFEKILQFLKDKQNFIERLNALLEAKFALDTDKSMDEKFLKS